MTTTIAFCEGCGSRLGEAAGFCASCGREAAAPRAIVPAGQDPRLLALPANVAPSQMALGSDADQVPLASFGRRWGAAILDNLLFYLTLGVGWLIWSWFTSADGQSPGKKIVGLRVVQQDTGRVASRGQAFARGALKAGFDLLSLFLLYIPWLIAAGIFSADPLRRTPWDRAMKTLVVHDPNGKTLGIQDRSPTRSRRRATAAAVVAGAALVALVVAGVVVVGHRNAKQDRFIDLAVEVDLGDYPQAYVQALTAHHAAVSGSCRGFFDAERLYGLPAPPGPLRRILAERGHLQVDDGAGKPLGKQLSFYDDINLRQGGRWLPSSYFDGCGLSVTFVLEAEADRYVLSFGGYAKGFDAGELTFVRKNGGSGDYLQSDVLLRIDPAGGASWQPK